MADASGNPTSRSATATVAITVEDVNDNNPVLENPHPEPIELLEVCKATCCYIAIEVHNNVCVC